MTEWLVAKGDGCPRPWLADTLQELRPSQLLDLLQHALAVLEERELATGPWPAPMHTALALAIYNVNALEASVRGQLALAAEAAARAG